VDYQVVAGDSGSVLRVTCKNTATNAPLDLTGKAVKLRFKLNGGSLVSRTMTVLTPQTNGQAEYQFAGAELSAAGTLECEVRINEGLSDQLTSLTLIVLPVRAPLS
jgi:hypothetical protein